MPTEPQPVMQVVPAEVTREDEGYDDPMEFENGSDGEVNGPSRRVSYSNIDPKVKAKAEKDDRTGKESY